MRFTVGETYRYCGLHRYCSGQQVDVCTIVATQHPLWGDCGVQVRFEDGCEQIVLPGALSPLATEEG